jgi:hypothetical protein
MAKRSNAAGKRAKRQPAAPQPTPAGTPSVDFLTILWGVLAILLPLALFTLWSRIPALGSPPKLLAGQGSSFPASTLLLEATPLGAPAKDQPLITHVQIVDLDGDGKQDVLACDSRLGRVVLLTQSAAGQWSEQLLGDRDLDAPCHTTVIDLDQDGDQDILVAILGSVIATDDHVGRAVWLENDGQGEFSTHVLLDDVRRVSDVQAGDLDGDGDLDVAVAEFGYYRGGLWWLENLGDGKFRERRLWAMPGCIHVPLADFDGDGDLDLICLCSQEEETVVAFENQGGGKLVLREKPLFRSPNFDLGTSGLVLTDLNQDGRPDLLLTAGDNLEIGYPAAQAWHGCWWLENRGGWDFAEQRLAHLAGTYAAAPGDLDADGDQDVALGSMCNDWRTPGAASCVWLENDGSQNFRPWQIADRPIHLATVACGDLNGDGRADIVAGSLHLLDPLDRLGRISVWLSRQETPP